MTSSVTFRTFIIGQGTLPIQCAELLSQKGHVVCGIITSDEFLSNWAKERRIPTIKPTENLIEFFGEAPFDFLFSIVNEHRSDLLLCATCIKSFEIDSSERHLRSIPLGPL